MSKDKKNQPKRWEQNFWKPVELPLDEPLGIYARQSTKRQLTANVQSNEIQREDLIKMAWERGWDESLIVLYDQDFAKSGTIGIDGRNGMSQMLTDIKALKIRAVFVYMEDRLFRDEYQINVDTFIKICSEAGCLILTPMMVYDLNNKWHRRQFRDACERAWEYLDEHIMYRLHMAKDRAAKQGLYDGRGLSFGYVVDKDKKSPTYKKFIIYEPHAKVIRYLFRRFVELDCSIAALAKELNNGAAIFPKEDPNYTPQFTRQRSIKVPGGYGLSYAGIRKILTNPVYIGWWKIGGEEPIKGNHEPIIDEGLFWYVHSRLVSQPKEKPVNEESQSEDDSDSNKEDSETDQESEEQEKMQHQRYHVTSPSVVRCVLSAEPYHIVANYPRGIYVIKEDKGLKWNALATISIDVLEQIFLDKFLPRLNDIGFYEEYAKAAEEDIKAEEERRAFVQEQYNQAQKRIDGIFLTLQDPDLDPEQRGEFIETRKKLIVQRDKYKRELDAPSALQQFYSYNELVQKIGPHWEKLPLELRQTFVSLLVAQVHLSYLSPHFIKIVIKWKRLGEDTGVIWRPMCSTYGWTEEELTALYELYPKGTTEELMQALPRRSYNAYNTKAQKLDIRKLERSTEPERPDLSLDDLRVIEEYQVPEENAGVIHSVTWRRRSITSVMVG